MARVYYTIKNPAKYVPEHKGAHYTLDGQHFFNGGEYVEIACKEYAGVPAEKDASTPYNVAADIPEYSASVKSSAATVVNMKLAETLEKSLDVYFENDASAEYWYGTIEQNILTIYKMTEKTFRRFLEKFCGLNERGYLRLKKENKQMTQWLKMNA